MSETKKVVIYDGSDEWSAVYLDGELQRVGDSYLADEWVREHFGVETIQSDDFLRGGDKRDDVAPTLAALKEWTDDRDARKRWADELREQAADLVARAAQVERGEG